jgi:hypothetical protein
MMANMAGSGASGFPVLQSVPLYMRESLIFPYSQGLMFQHKVVSKMGKKASRKCSAGPRSRRRRSCTLRNTSRKARRSPRSCGPFPKEKDWKKLTEGSVGEFDHKILLKQYSPSMELLAEKWRGAYYQLWEQKKDSNRVALTYYSQWADNKSAAEFFAAYKDILTKKWKKTKFSEDKTPTRSPAGVRTGAFLGAASRGARVSSLEGLRRTKRRTRAYIEVWRAILPAARAFQRAPTPPIRRRHGRKPNANSLKSRGPLH